MGSHPSDYETSNSHEVFRNSFKAWCLVYFNTISARSYPAAMKPNLVQIPDTPLKTGHQLALHLYFCRTWPHRQSVSSPPLPFKIISSSCKPFANLLLRGFTGPSSPSDSFLPQCLSPSCTASNSAFNSRSFRI